MTKTTKKFFILFTLLLLFSPGVDAEETDTPGSTLRVMLPESLSGYSLLVRDAAGTVLSETQIDTTGTTEISSLENASDIVVNTEKIGDSPESETVYSKENVVFYLAIAVIISAAVFFYLGRRRAKKIINMLRDEVYEEDFD